MPRAKAPASWRTANASARHRRRRSRPGVRAKSNAKQIPARPRRPEFYPLMNTNRRQTWSGVLRESCEFTRIAFFRGCCPAETQAPHEVRRDIVRRPDNQPRAMKANLKFPSHRAGKLGAARFSYGRILIPPPPDAARRKGTQRLRCSMGRCSRRGSLKAAFRWWFQDARFFYRQEKISLTVVIVPAKRGTIDLPLSKENSSPDSLNDSIRARRVDISQRLSSAGK